MLVDKRKHRQAVHLRAPVRYKRDCFHAAVVAFERHIVINVERVSAHTYHQVTTRTHQMLERGEKDREKKERKGEKWGGERKREREKERKRSVQGCHRPTLTLAFGNIPMSSHHGIAAALTANVTGAPTNGQSNLPPLFLLRTPGDPDTTIDAASQSSA